MTQATPVRPARSSALGSALLILGLAIFALALRPTALTLPRFYASDSGVFYAVFDRLARGDRLYADVFDHKDPLFYLFYTASYALLGIAGPMLWETCLTLGGLALAVLVGRLAGLGLAGQAIAALGFAGFFVHPAAYFPIHSNHQALTLALAALALGLARRDWLAGALMGAVLLSKLTHALFLPALALCILAFDPQPPSRASLARLLRMGAAALGVIALGTLGLLAVGSLPGYLDALQVNVRYQAQYDRIQALYWPGTPGSPLEMIREQMSPALLGVNAALLLSALAAALWPRRLDPGARARATLLAASGLAAANAAALILDSSYAWPHYYEVLALPALIAAIAGLAAGAGRWLRGWVAPAAVAGYVAVAALSGALSPAPSHIGWAEGQRSSDEQEAYLQPCIVEQMQASGATTFASTGGNRAVQAARLVPPGARLVCRAFYQFPWFSGTVLDEFLTCVASQQPEIIFQRGADFPLDIERPLAVALRDGYEYQASCGDIDVLRRR